MKNIQFQTLNKFGSTSRRKIDGRKFTSYVKHMSYSLGISEYEFLKIYIEKLFLDDANSHLVSCKLSWLDKNGNKHSIHLKH